MEKADLLYWQKHSSATGRAAYIVIKVIYHVVSLAGWLPIWLSRPARRPQASPKLRGHAINTVWLVTRRGLA